MITPAQFSEMEARTFRGKKVEPTQLKPVACLVISGQIRGGKNNMIVTRTGLHFPKPEWAKWRDEAVAQIKRQLPPCFKPLDVRINMRLKYIAGDKRRRDMPAILDSIFHVLEKAGVVSDDTQLWVTESSRSYDKEKPMALIYLETAEDL
jgi:crossover junction endodeoxyribonuclease RusA